MRRIPYMIYTAQWAAFVFRGLAWLAYSMLEFVSKPGTRILVPLAVCVAAYLSSSAVRDFAVGFGTAAGDSSAVSGYLFLGIAFLVMCAIYYGISKFLSLVLGVFSPIRRPISPIAPIVTPARLDEAVAVRIVVTPPAHHRIR